MRQCQGELPHRRNFLKLLGLLEQSFVTTRLDKESRFGRIPCGNSHTKKSGKRTLGTDTGVDQKLQRDLGAIGPHEFQGGFVWRNILVDLYDYEGQEVLQTAKPPNSK